MVRKCLLMLVMTGLLVCGFLAEAARLKKQVGLPKMGRFFLQTPKNLCIRIIHYQEDVLCSETVYEYDEKGSLLIYEIEDGSDCEEVDALDEELYIGPTLLFKNAVSSFTQNDQKK